MNIKRLYKDNIEMKRYQLGYTLQIKRLGKQKQLQDLLIVIVKIISLISKTQMTVQPDPHQNLLLIEDRNFDDNSCKRYLKGNFLGKGGFARCYQIINEQTKLIEAVKIIQKSSLTKPRSKQKLMSEIKIHQSLNHKNIVEFRRNFEDHINVYIVLEICTNKTLNDLFKRKRRLSECQIKYYLLQVLNALEYLHGRKIIHRDLKLGNLFLNENMEIKVGDFGLATKLQFPGEKRKTICGTPNYIAPQILESKGHSTQVDIWSFGVICYTLAFGRPPFESKDVKQTYKKIKTGSFTFPEQISISTNFKQVVMSCLQKDPQKRPTCVELKNFQFFMGVSLSRQPSISFRAQTSMSIARQQKQLSRSDNGKMYTNNELVTSKDTARQKSQDKFLVTERSATSIQKHLNPTISTALNNTNLRRANSQRVLKQTNLQMTKTISKSPSKQQFNQQDFGTVTSVKKWIDYSSKYGIGYALTNGWFGVYFNDSSKMLSLSEEQFYYIQKVDREDVKRKYYFNEYPSELKKKVSLFGHFKGYLGAQTENTPSKSVSQKDLIYVRRWYRAKHAVIFRLSNKSVQVIFIDQSEILINSSTKKVIFTSKNKEKSEHWLNQIMQSQNRQLIKRFEYTKEVLNQMASQQDRNKG